MFYNEGLPFMEAKKNLNKQATKVLHDIVSAYAKGSLEDPEKAYFYCNLLACICEGKVQGIMDEESCEVKWSLTPEYQSQIDALRESLASENVIAGPWGPSV